MDYTTLKVCAVGFAVVLVWLAIEVYLDRKSQREWRETLRDRDESGKHEACKPPKIYL